MPARRGDGVVARMSMLSLALAVAAVGWGLVSAPLSRAISDKLSAPGAAKGQETKVIVREDGEAGEYRWPSLDILENGKVTCGHLEMKGAIFAPVVGRITFRTVEFGSCVYLGSRARLNTSSCGAVITSGGLGKLTKRKCDLRVEIPGCTVHLGKGLFLELGYHNAGSPAETIALTEPIAFGGTAIGAACLSPGPAALGQFTGHLRFSASRNGAKQPFIVIL